MSIVSHLINGLSIGSVYALVALGYTMVYGIIKLINFAHGDLIMVGAYNVFVFMSLGFGFVGSVVASMVVVAILGVVLEKLAYRPLRNADRINALITAIGVSIFLQNAVMLIAGPNPKTFPTTFSGNVIVLGYSIEKISLVTIIVAFVCMLLLAIFIKYTKMGKAMRAVSEDNDAARLMGINVDLTISVTFAIGSTLAVVAGALYCSAYPTINPTLGAMFGLKAFVAAVLGGIGIIPGAMVGGLLLGVLESLTKVVLPSQISDAITFSILIVVLLVKPTGLFGKNQREKV